MENRIEGSLRLSEVIPKIKHLLKPNPYIITCDMIISFAIYYCLIFLSVWVNSWALSALLAVLSGIAFFRCLIFIHEAYHLKEKYRFLTTVYDLGFGILNKMPSFIYFPHSFHHYKKTYGTSLDPEYEAIAKQPPYKLLILPIVFLFVPIFYFIRHGILPVTLPFMGKRGRNFVYTYLSTFAMNLNFKRPALSVKEHKVWIIQEVATFLVNSGIIALCIVDIIPWKLFLVWSVSFYVFYFINYYRVLVSHRYTGADHEFSAAGQIADSLTIPKSSLFYQLFFPLGLQYHTLHHMFPTTPYYNLGKLHRRLMQILPDDHPYRESIQQGYFQTLRILVNNMSSNSKISNQPSVSGLNSAEKLGFLTDPQN